MIPSLAAMFMLSGAANAAPVTATDKPVQVFIMMGQSNMKKVIGVLQAREDAGVRARKNTPAVVTEDGSVQIVVVDGKRALAEHYEENLVALIK
eukprot:gene31621-8145_t